MQREQFALATKSSSSLLSPLERRLAARVVPRIPLWLGTHHLTMLTLAWCAGLVAFGYLAKDDLRWLWGSSALIALQWATDFFDGKVGKYRDTGLVKWGFYMDHLLDYAFLCALLIGYAIILPEHARPYLFFILAIFGNDRVDATADDFLGAVSEDALSAAIPGGDDALQRLADDGIIRRLDNSREFRLRLAQTRRHA